MILRLMPASNSMNRAKKRRGSEAGRPAEGSPLLLEAAILRVRDRFIFGMAALLVEQLLHYLGFPRRVLLSGVHPYF